MVRAAGWLALLVFAVPAAAGEFDRIDEYVQRRMQQDGVTGAAIAVVKAGRIVHMQGFGDSSPDVPITPHTPFPLASVSKSFTALAVMQQVEAGKVDLDAPVVRYLPSFQVANVDATQRITVRHLLSHTSGLSTLSGRKQFFARDVGPPALDRGVRELATESLTATPGERFQYSNSNFVTAAAVVASVSGIPFEQYVRERIFAPLGMKNSFTREADAHGLTKGYRQWWGKAIAATDIPYSHAMLGAGGLFASAEDLGLYLAEMMAASPKLLSPSGMGALRRTAVELRPGRGYALGWWVHGKLALHDGDLEHCHADLIFAPEEGVGVALLTNTNSPRLYGRLSNTADNVMAMARDREAVPFKPDPAVSVILFAPLAVLLLQALSVARLEWRIRRWRAGTRPRPWMLWMGSVGAVAFHLGAAYVLVIGAPAAFDIPFSALFLFSPDYAWPAAIAGGFGVLWAALRTVLVIRGYRRAETKVT